MSKPNEAIASTPDRELRGTIADVLARGDAGSDLLRRLMDGAASREDWRELLRSAGLKQSDIASESGVSDSYISAIVNGRRAPSRTVLAALWRLGALPGDERPVTGAMSQLRRQLAVDVQRQALVFQLLASSPRVYVLLVAVLSRQDPQLTGRVSGFLEALLLEGGGSGQPYSGGTQTEPGG